MEEHMRVVKGSSGRWMYDTGRRLMEASCHHQKRGACGGCYARAIETLSAIREDDDNATARSLLEHLKAEKTDISKRTPAESSSP
jgi:hypothetical protein